MDRSDLRETSVAKALPLMQFVAVGDKEVYHVIDESGIDPMDFHRIYPDCFTRVEERVAEYERQVLELQVKLELVEKQLELFQISSD